MPMVIALKEGGPPKKKRFLSEYGDEPTNAMDEGEDAPGAPDVATERLMHMAEKTGVKDPEALLALVKACVADCMEGEGE